jgi:4-amino-4-deoxy-L-arabinose transferase-like glycosyltransferase
MVLKGWMKAWPVFCLVPFLGWWLIGLTDLDEGFYGAVAADMIRRGDWITPSISGEPWFEKPILIYWLAIPTIKVFGETLGPKMPSVIGSLVIAWLVWRFCRDRLTPQAAVLAPLAVSGSVLSVAVGRMMLTDALLVASLCGCFFLYWESLQGRPQLRVGAAACLGLAVLAKGPVAGVFFIVIAALVYWRLPEFRPGHKGWWLASIGAGLAVMAAWYVPCWLVNGDLFVQKFLIEQNIGRFAGGDKAHGLPAWWLHLIFYPVVLAAGLLPWLPGAARRGLFSGVPKGDETPFRKERVFLWIWALTVVVFFSLSGSKLPHYILPALPPLMILAVERLTTGREEKLDKLVWGAACWAVFVMIAATLVFGAEYQRQKGPELHGLVKEIRDDPAPVVLYRFGRSQSATDFSLQINETSRPSMFFYLRRPAEKTSDMAELLKVQGKEVLILTPEGRLTPEDRDVAEAQGLTIAPSPEKTTAGFEVFRGIRN